MTDELYHQVFACGCIRFGEFKLRSGLVSPFYVDLRVLISCPQTLRALGEEMAQLLKQLAPDRIAALPYAGLPIGVAASMASDIPLIYPRKEAKGYGTGRLIEGSFNPGERAVVVDDVITDGATKIEAIKPLEEAGLVVKDVVILLDREQGGDRVLARHGYTLHALMHLTPTLDALVRLGHITDEQRQAALRFVAEHQFS
ncbi:MAG TPA: orotate phosphoribosyltransferase [Armatimonadetes bacterium]|jgi:uridine monophosphate synthetase|nr:orotate phosphoribosyltransferase [Armatimonadota bacterium]